MALSEATSGAAMPSSLPRWRHKATGITRKAPSKRPLMRRKPIWSARQAWWDHLGVHWLRRARHLEGKNVRCQSSMQNCSGGKSLTGQKVRL